MPHAGSRWPALTILRLAGGNAAVQQRYREEVRAKLRAEFGYKNEMQVPRLEKIVINMGVGEATGDQKKLDAAVAELTRLPGSGR